MSHQFIKNEDISVFILLLIISLLVVSKTEAQTFKNKVKGRVLAYETGKPLENVNVYVSGTIWGTTTDEYGNFEIDNLPSGNNEIVASIIGYVSRTKLVHLANGNISTLTFKLQEAHYELEAVTVSGDIPTAWKNNYQIFRKRFLGNSKFASGCIINNPEVLNFTWNNSHHLTARTEKPLIIVNNDLGYKISCILVSFDWDAETYQVQAAVRPSFSEMKDTTGLLKAEWNKNREKAYEGSIDNFLQVIKDGKLNKEGFQIYQDFGPMSEVPLKRLNHVWTSLVRKSNGQYSLSFTGYLRVLYTLKDPDNPQVSWIKLLYPTVTLDMYGYPVEPIPFEVYGYWTDMGMADMLPKYYSPIDSLGNY